MIDDQECPETYREAYACDLPSGHDGPHKCLAGRWHNVTESYEEFHSALKASNDRRTPPPSPHAAAPLRQETTMSENGQTAAALLDQLDALRAAAKPGAWTADGRIVFHNGASFMAPWKADAALIVAAVNNAPRLVAALRGVLGLADELAAKCPPDDWGSGGVDDAIQADTGRAFRSTIAAALTDGTPR